MAFLRKQTSEGSIGLLYSIIQKCIRRGLEEECLYYSNILYNISDGIEKCNQFRATAKDFYKAI